MADRAMTLGRLQGELRAAQDRRDITRAAVIEREIARLSAGTPADPLRETLAGKG